MITTNRASLLEAATKDPLAHSFANGPQPRATGHGNFCFDEEGSNAFDPRRSASIANATPVSVRSRRTADIADRCLYVAIGREVVLPWSPREGPDCEPKAALPLRARKVDFTEGLNLTSSWLKSAFDNWNSHARLLHW